MWSRSGIGSALAFGMTAASSSAEPAIGSLVPTAISVGVRIDAACSRVSTCREPRMQAASARRSDLVWSAKARNMRPCGSVTSASDGASSASAMLSGRPTPSTRCMPSPPSTIERTRSGCSSARKAAIRAPIE